MADESTPKHRLFRMLRRTAAGARPLPFGKTMTEQNALWLAHEKAGESARQAADAAQQVASHLAKGRGQSDAAADRARALVVRSKEVTATFARLSDVFERLGLVALNAGLEGSRLGEGVGRSLSLLSDEVRTHAQRGGEIGRDLERVVGEIASELAFVQTNLDRSTEASHEASHAAAKAAASAAQAQTALADVGERVKKATGSDPETIRGLVEASEHARALVSALGSLSGKVPRGLLTASLRPVLEPLLRYLDDEDEEGDAAIRKASQRDRDAGER